tara:strand:+ start:289 stop:528 length:240 start_codon:yes stop_codon:yes gene_type:complete
MKANLQHEEMVRRANLGLPGAGYIPTNNHSLGTHMQRPTFRNRLMCDGFLQIMTYVPVFMMGIAAGALINQAVSGQNFL